MNRPTLGQTLYAYFEDHLKTQRGLRPASIKSYRDAMRLFLAFVARDAGRKITRLTLADLTEARVRRFLKHVEVDRGNTVRTRNHRLAALRSFFEFVAERVPELLAEAERVAAIPTKRTAPPETHYLERDDIETLFNNLPRDGPSALRDRALLLLLYNTGARVQEAADIRVADLELDNHRVQLHGKGDKRRICPLWPQTVSLLEALLGEPTTSADLHRPVFASRSGQPLTRFGIYKLVRRHTRCLAKRRTPGQRAISPHVFRHTTAVHLLEAGVEVNVIRAWLGHVHLDTTNRYAEINIRMKQAALEICEPPISASETFHRRTIWRDDPSLLKWLESL